MKKSMFITVLAAALTVLLSSCGLPGGANYSPNTIKADAVTSAGSYNSIPATDVAVHETQVGNEGNALFITKDPTDETVKTGQLNSDLIISYQGEDTIALNNIPLSLDGWSVRAVFEGQDGPLTGNSAKITVIDYENPYSTIIMRYSKAFRFGVPSADYCKANGISTRAAECYSVGYSLYDIDENGVDELFIAAYDTSAYGYQRNMIFELYTVADGEPYRVYCSKNGNEMYLIGEGRLLSVSSAPGMTSHGIYHLANDFLIYEEVYTEEKSSESPDTTVWRHRLDNSIGYSDDEPISEVEALEAIDTIHGFICLPYLSPIG